MTSRVTLSRVGREREGGGVIVYCMKELDLLCIEDIDTISKKDTCQTSKFPKFRPMHDYRVCG